MISAYSVQARVNWRWLLRHWIPWAFVLDFQGQESMPARMAMIATTSNSMSVKARPVSNSRPLAERNRQCRPQADEIRWLADPHVPVSTGESRRWQRPPHRDRSVRTRPYGLPG